MIHLALVMAAVTTLHLRTLWIYRARHWITSTPAVVNGLVYAGTWGGNVVALDASNGRLRWVAGLGVNPNRFYGEPRGVTSSVAVSRGIAYAVSGSCRAGAFNARTGRVVWTRRVCSIARNDDTYASPAVGDGLVLLGIDVLGDRPTDRGRVVALDSRTGAIRWTLYPQRYRGSGTGISATPLIDASRGLAYVGTGNPTPIGSPPPGADRYSESILAVAMRSGALRWAFGPVHPHDLHDNDLFASPNRFTIGSREIIGEGGKDGIYYAVDASTGRLAWRARVAPGNPYASIIGTPACAGGKIFVPVYAGNRGALVALLQRDGRIAWSRKLAGVYEAPAIWKGIVFAVEDDATLVAFDASSGRLLLRVRLAGRSYGRGPRAAGSTLYVTAGDALTAYRIERVRSP